MATSTPCKWSVLIYSSMMAAFALCFVPCDAVASFPADFPKTNPPAPRGLLLEDAYIAINTTVFAPAESLPREQERLPVTVDALPARHGSTVLIQAAKVVAICGQYKWGQNWCE